MCGSLAPFRNEPGKQTPITYRVPYGPYMRIPCGWDTLYVAVLIAFGPHKCGYPEPVRIWDREKVVRGSRRSGEWISSESVCGVPLQVFKVAVVCASTASHASPTSTALPRMRRSLVPADRQGVSAASSIIVAAIERLRCERWWPCSQHAKPRLA